jgi:hypothetical protein
LSFHDRRCQLRLMIEIVKEFVQSKRK